MEEELDIEIDVDLGELPSQWQWTTLGDVCEKPQYGWTTKADKDKGKIKLLRTTDITSGDIDWSSVPYCTEVPDDLGKYLVEPGDIVISRAGSVGVSYLLADVEPAVFASYLIRFRPKSTVDERYLYHYLQSSTYWTAIGASKAGIAVPNVNAKKLARVPFPLAPLPKQRRIITAIETQLGRLDAAVARLHAAKDKLKRYRQAVLHEVFSEEWDTARLDEVCLKIQDGSHFSPKEQFSEPANGRYLYITSKNIRNGYMDLSNLVYVTKEYFDSIYPRCKPELNDVLLTKDGANTGNVTMNTLEEPYALLSSVCLLKPDRSKLMPEFLMYFIQSPDGFKQLTGKMTGTAIKRIILERIREAPIPLPTLAEQKQLVEYVATRFDAANETESTLDTQLLQAGRLRQAVLKRAFEGRLV